MFDSLKIRLLLGLYIFLIISIPIGAYLASQVQNTKGKAEETKTITREVPKTATSSAGAREILNASESNIDDLSASLDSSPDSESPTVATSFGPTLSLKATMEGRSNDQSTTLFVGIIEGDLTSNPKFLLSFSVKLPPSGEYTNLSLAGLSSGTKYTALLKGNAQIATSISFVMSPNISNLNSGEALNMLTGDLNEDNVINSSDYGIVQKAFSSTSSSGNWNELADLNKDGVVNTFDLGIISKNLGKIGASGAWTSPIPVATSSASLTGSAQGSPGYWIYIPK